MSKPPILTPFLDDIDVILYAGDCIEVMRQMPEASVDAIVTDPPYGLSFMGRGWDTFAGEANAGARGGTQDKGILPGYGRGGTSADRVKFRADEALAFQSFSEAWAREALRILKPGGHLLAFAGTRTYHRMASGVEDAGFEIRDCIAWMYGSGSTGLAARAENTRCILIEREPEYLQIIRDRLSQLNLFTEETQ